MTSCLISSCAEHESSEYVVKQHKIRVASYDTVGTKRVIRLQRGDRSETSRKMAGCISILEHCSSSSFSFSSRYSFTPSTRTLKIILSEYFF